MQNGRSNSPWKSARLLYHNLGFKGLYRGWFTTALREMLYFGPYFVTYDFLRRLMQEQRNRGQNASPVIMAHSLISGGIAGCVGWFVILPADYIKSVCCMICS